MLDLAQLSSDVECVTRTRYPDADVDASTRFVSKYSGFERKILMVHFNGSPTKSALSLPIARLAPGMRQELVQQSAEWVCVNTHWFGRRLWCGGDGCPGCDSAPTRTVAYCVVGWQSPDRFQPLLLESTPQELARLNGLTQMEGLEIAPGLVFEATKAKKQSPTRLEPIRAGGLTLPEFSPPRIALAAAAVLAGAPVPAADDSFESYLTRIQPALDHLIAKAMKA